MKQVASLRYGVIFKKAFCDLEIFKTFVHDVLGITLEIDKVETEKTFDKPISKVIPRFDLYAEDLKNRVIVDIQHERLSDYYHRFLYYHCVALLEQISKAVDYRPTLKVFTIVVLTSGDKHGVDVSVIDFDPHDLKGKALGEIPHKVYYLCPKYATDQTPSPYREWLQAIDDTLDNIVDETAYQNPIIRRVFDLIEDDLVSPKERAKMFDESGDEKLLDDAVTKAKLEIAKAMLADGFAPSVIARLTKLSVAEIEELNEEES